MQYAPFVPSKGKVANTLNTAFAVIMTKMKAIQKLSQHREPSRLNMSYMTSPSPLQSQQSGPQATSDKFM